MKIARMVSQLPARCCLHSFHLDAPIDDDETKPCLSQVTTVMDLAMGSCMGKEVMDVIGTVLDNIEDVAANFYPLLVSVHNTLARDPITLNLGREPVV